MKKFFFFFLFVSFWCEGQVLYPIIKSQNANTRIAEDSIVISLPFFDDFSNFNYELANNWEFSNGVYINSNYALNPPSVGVATFDGISSSGLGYIEEDSEEVGQADVLTSHFFDLSEYENRNLVLSFFWNNGNYGEFPDVEDSFSLEVKDRENNWFELWSVSGGEVGNSSFSKEEVLIENADFKHDSFQFRFVSKGRKTGSYDVWHLDYVYFFSEGSDRKDLRIDFAQVKKPTSPFGKYSSLPMSQLPGLYQEILSDTIFSKIRNLSDTFNIILPKATVREVYSNQQETSLSTIAVSENGQNEYEEGAFISSGEVLTIKTQNQLPNIDFTRDSLLFEYTFFLDSIETNEVIRTTTNDTITSYYHFSNYIAYDDGSAETGLSVHQRFGKTAQRYTISESDFITGVDLYFPYYDQSLEGQPFGLSILTNLSFDDQQEENIIYEQSLPFRYSNGINQFFRYEFTNPIAVSDTFFVAIQQLSDLDLIVGFDLETGNGSEVFFKTGNLWERNTKFNGSLMIRPVFSKSSTILSTEIPDENFKITLFPNPASSFIKVGLPFNISSPVSLVDLLGKKVHSFQTKFNQKEYLLNIDNIPEGLYFIQAFSPNKTLKKSSFIIYR